MKRRTGPLLDDRANALANPDECFVPPLFEAICISQHLGSKSLAININARIEKLVSIRCQGRIAMPAEFVVRFIYGQFGPPSSVQPRCIHKRKSRS
jgi:hypothetical protein